MDLNTQQSHKRVGEDECLDMDDERMIMKRFLITDCRRQSSKLEEDNHLLQQVTHEVYCLTYGMNYQV